MKPVVNRKNLAEKNSKGHSDCGRMKYFGIDMAFIHVRGKRMLTMSEVARKLYPHWPRTTLSGRMKQLNIRRHFCTPREIDKVRSVNGVVKQGIHCTLISKADLDTFRSVYEANMLPTQKERIPKSKKLCCEAHVEKKRTSLSGAKQINSGNQKGNSSARAKEKNALIRNKQKDNRGTRVACEAGKALGHKRHVAQGVNKANSKQQHVVRVGRSHGNSRQLPNPPLKQINEIRKRKHSTQKETGNTTSKSYLSTTKRRRNGRDTSSPTSDCTSLDSGISSLTTDTPGSRSGTIRKNNNCEAVKSKFRGTSTKNKKGLKTKGVKVELNALKIKGVKSKNRAIGLTRKREKIRSNGKNEKESGFKRTKISHCSKTGSDTITKELIMKMDLKHMNDNELINSFSSVSTPFSTPDISPVNEEQNYHVKLMPVKPVWKVNSSFKFISNFLLPPSLVVRNGELRPACSMACNPGLRPPSAHPIWKWKIGEPVIGNKTEISYRMKKVKCVDSQTKKP